MTRTIINICLALTVIVAMSLPASAQTSITTTTLTNAMTTTAPRQDIVVGSASGMAVGSTFLYIDGSIYRINAISGTTITVTNFYRPVTHNASVTVYVVPLGAQVGLDGVGSCIRGTTGTFPQYSPYTLMFNTQNGNISVCRLGVRAAGKYEWSVTNPYSVGAPSANPPQTP